MEAIGLAPFSGERYVHFGHIAVDTAGAGDFALAAAYLGRDRIERSLFRRLAEGPPVRVAINRRNHDAYDPNTRTIFWDPRSALRTTDGGRQSPALGLGHEIDHAVEPPASAAVLDDLPDARFDNREERRVILGSERHAARALGEDARRDHGGTTFRVATPVSR